MLPREIEAYGGRSALRCHVPFKVAIDKGWPGLLTDNEPLPWCAEIVSEHDDGKEAADAFDQLKAALAQASDGETSGMVH